jgi:hypothetical protein
MGMRRYGLIRELPDPEDDYFKYERTEP